MSSSLDPPLEAKVRLWLVRRVPPLKRRAEAPMLQKAALFGAGEPSSSRRSSGSAANAPPASWSVEIMSCRLMSVSGPRSSTRAPVRKGLRFSLSSQTLQLHTSSQVRLRRSTRSLRALVVVRKAAQKITQWSLLIGREPCLAQMPASDWSIGRSDSTAMRRNARAIERRGEAETA